MRKEREGENEHLLSVCFVPDTIICFSFIFPSWKTVSQDSNIFVNSKVCVLLHTDSLEAEQQLA